MPRRPLFVCLAGVLAGILAGSAACSAGNAKSAAQAGASPTATAVATPPASSVAQATPDSLTVAADQGRILGAESAPVWLLIVSDFQCPWCKVWHDSAFATLKREYVDAGKVRFAYMNFPLSIHANAIPAAMAAMCASAQGKFWETHERIFLTQKKWEVMPNPAAYLDSLAVASGADATKQRACTSTKAMQGLIEADLARARKAGAGSTPTFFIGGSKIEGAAPVGAFRHALDSALATTKK
jgi:protein-disulfide isomerase